MRCSTVVLGIALAWGLAGCDGLTLGGGEVGNGRSAEDVRPLTDFTRVVNRTSFDVHVVQGSTFRVAVTADSNILPLVRTTAVHGVLTIETTRGYTSRLPCHVDIVLAHLDGVDNAGSGSVTTAAPHVEAVTLSQHGSGALSFSGQAGSVAVDLVGSGAITLNGTGGTLDAHQRGSGGLDAEHFAATGVNLVSTGSGAATLRVRGNSVVRLQGSGSVNATLDEGTADLSVQGSGSIEWSGGATVVRSSTQGSGRIVHR